MSSPKGISLSDLKQLSPNVYLLEPATKEDATPTASITSKSIASSDTPLPKLIILFTWMGAAPSHISKYISGYRDHFPSSRLLIIRNSPADLFYRSSSTQRRWLAPAIDVLLSTISVLEKIEQNKQQKPDLLIHIFSNGGSTQLLNFLRTYYLATSSNVFPSHIKILDSCPGTATFQRSVRAMAVGLPPAQPLRLLLLIVTYIVIAAYWLAFSLNVISDPIGLIRRGLNDKALIKGELKRGYIYSEADQMVDWRVVEEHARDAEAKGFVVRREKFVESGHVAHMRVGGGVRYWGIVEGMWEEVR